MSQINLTTRKFWKCRCGERNKIELDKCSVCGKNQPLLQSIGSHLWNKDEKTEKVTYEVRYSEAFQPVGHDYNQSFKILREMYWFVYEILDEADIATYETLQFLCEKRIPFTLEILAKRKKVAEKTLRQQLDNLQNAELLELYEMDAPGKPYHYVLKTPYHSRDEFTGESGYNRKLAVIEAYGAIPESFIEDNYLRLRQQVRKNYVRRLKRLYKSKDLKERHPKAFREINRRIEDKKLFWFRLVKYFGQNKAAALDDVIWKLAKSDFSNIESTHFESELKKRITNYFNQLHLDKNNLHWAIRLFHHYCPKVLVKSRATAHNGTSAAPADNGENADGRAFPESVLEEQKNLLRKFLEAKRPANNSVWSKAQIKEVIRVCKEWSANLDIKTVEAVAADILPEFILKKLTVELRT